MTLSTSALRNAWAPACKPKGGVYLAAYKALDAILKRHGYGPRRTDTGAYNCRRITGGTGYSLHAFGPGDKFTFWNGVTISTSLAVDINWSSNPYGRKLVTDMPPAMVAEIKAIRTGNGKQVWRWGGDYTTNKDAMHYEIVCTPADLATGIKGSSPAPPQGSGIPHDVLRQGAKGAKVTAIQYTLNFLGHRCAVDGVFGPNTTAAVKAFQAACKSLGSKVTVDGVWGPQTAALAEWWTVATLAGKR